MKILFYVWMPRTEFPAKPPYFGGMPTWVYVAQVEMERFDEDEVVEIVDELFSKYPTGSIKVVAMEGRKVLFKRYYGARG